MESGNQGERMQGETRGFTLVELAVTLAVTGILLAVAMPSFAQQRRHHLAVADGGFIVARGESLCHGRPVSECSCSTPHQPNCIGRDNPTGDAVGGGLYV